MSWRNVFINNPAKLSLKNNQLLVTQNDTISLPLEDIGVIIVENPQVTFTSKLLSKITEYKIVLYVCDDKHLPCGIYTAFQQHSRQLKVLRSQLAMTKPFTKRCWQKIVQQKIINQAKCLSYLGKEGHAELVRISKCVESGDTNNTEAHAARIYFLKLLQCFSRKADNTINAGLNYGYAIFRGAIARSIVTYGFLPSIGIHHNNELNKFNLADDMIEVFRPVVDLWVINNLNTEMEFSSEHRIGLVNLLNNDILFEEETYAILRAIDNMVSSFSAACINGDSKLLKLPILKEIKLHNYE